MESGALAALLSGGAWKVAAAALGQTALLTALLVYFGWVRTQTTFNHFGLDAGMLELSTRDYVIRSVGSIYDPLLLVGLVFLGAALLGRFVHGRPARSPALRAWLVRLGGLLVAIGAAATQWDGFARKLGSWIPNDPGIAFAWLPATLAAGFALLLYGSLLAGSGASGSPGTATVRVALLALLVLSLFWVVSLLAVQDGRRRAEDIERNAGALAEAAVLSRDPLIIQGPGVVHTDLGIDGARYRHSYVGLRVLAHAQGKYYLLPLVWQRGVDRVYTVPDDPTVRLELIAH